MRLDRNVTVTSTGHKNLSANVKTYHMFLGEQNNKRNKQIHKNCKNYNMKIQIRR